jgi:SPP1 gp7 family putative phage head morphogenesis protein
MDNEGQELSDQALERFARTKTTEVFNKGRKAAFDETGIVSAYQYSAVLDDRTSDICEGLDNCIFEKGDEPTPPMHFNCRSILVPITKFEDYEADDNANDGTNLDDFIEQNKGKGFPTS